jgi:hypothetical protein
LEVLFGSDGAVKHALVVRGLGFGLDEEALKAARGIEFKPGEVDGQPVSMWMGVEILFGPVEIERERRENPRIANRHLISPRGAARQQQVGNNRSLGCLRCFAADRFQSPLRSP